MSKLTMVSQICSYHINMNRCRTRIYTRGSFTGPGVRGHYLHLPKHRKLTFPYRTCWPDIKHSSAAMSQDVVFTYHQGTQLVQKTLLWKDRKASREALGIWKVDGRAWKVYEKDGQYQKLMDDYLRAEVDAGLPMGKFSFLKGTVKRSKAPTNGFVLETEWMEGANFQKGSFKQALERGEIPHEKATDDYGR